MSGTLIDTLIQLGNKSGSIQSAPMGMKMLKESIEGVPFELLTKGMSGIFDQLGAQLGQLAQAMGGLQNLGGNFQSVLGSITNGTISPDQILQSFGGVTAMTAALSSFTGVPLQTIASAAQGNPQAIAAVAQGAIKTGG